MNIERTINILIDDRVQEVLGFTSKESERVRMRNEVKLILVQTLVYMIPQPIITEISNSYEY